MDLVALIAAVTGMCVARAGYLTAGSTLVAIPLLLLAPAFVRRRTERLLFAYGGHGSYLVLPLAALVTLGLAIWLPRATAVAFGLGFYYFGAAMLTDNSVHYAPRGSVLAVRATRSERALAYWLIVGAMFTISAVLLSIALLTLSGEMDWQ
jgi:hypothetical protein